jgi:1,4-dihydroxy-2-naphthoate octaprenyltransferase
MTLTSGLMAVLLAAIAPAKVDWLNITLAVIGIVVAHLANNLMNDLADTEVGTDTEKYPRALYAPHPILSGLVTKRQLFAGILLCQVIDLVIMLTLVARRDWWIAAFALGGLFLSWAYTAPPLRLKRIGLGELDVLLTWGPLMVGGVYYAGTGSLTWQVLAAATVYALLPTSVLMGKHIDKLPYDRPSGTNTFPVLVGEKAARLVTQAMMIGYYVGVIVLVILKSLALARLADPAGRAAAHQRAQGVQEAHPDRPPPNYPIWPLWWAPIAFLHTRRAGGCSWAASSPGRSGPRSARRGRGHDGRSGAGALGPANGRSHCHSGRDEEDSEDDPARGAPADDERGQQDGPSILATAVPCRRSLGIDPVVRRGEIEADFPCARAEHHLRDHLDEPARQQIRRPSKPNRRRPRARTRYKPPSISTPERPTCRAAVVRSWTRRATRTWKSTT